MAKKSYVIASRLDETSNTTIVSCSETLNRSDETVATVNTTHDNILRPNPHIRENNNATVATVERQTTPVTPAVPKLFNFPFH